MEEFKQELSKEISAVKDEAESLSVKEELEKVSSITLIRRIQAGLRSQSSGGK